MSDSYKKEEVTKIIKSKINDDKPNKEIVLNSRNKDVEKEMKEKEEKEKMNKEAIELKDYKPNP